MQKIEKKLNEVLTKLNVGERCEVLFSNRPDLCDFQCNVAFSLAKKLKVAPFAIANQIKDEFLAICSEFDVSVAGGFLNFSCKKDYLKEIFTAIADSENFGLEEENKTILVDYGGANIAKPLHVGHLRAAFIGQAICDIARFCGNKVIGDVHLGDYGLQMGLTTLYYIENYDCSPFFEKTNYKADFINEETIEVAYPLSSAKSKIDESYKERAREITVKIQTGEKGYVDIYKQLYDVSLAMVKNSYDRLGTKFDLFLGESDAQKYVDEVVATFKNKGLLKESDGALIVEVATDSDTAPMPPMLVKASSGADLYPTTECATLVMREKTLNADEYWYVTDARQALHFEQVFRAVKKAGIVAEGKVLKHLPFGTMNGKDGKPFKTRNGGNYKLNDLLDDVEAKAKEKLAQNGTPDENNLSKIIALGALKFGDLINFRSKDILFDMDKMMSFEGKTGPYIQYSLVRIKSILSKANAKIGEVNANLLDDKQRKLIIQTIKLAYSIIEAEKLCAPNVVAQALYELCNEFSTFYNNTKILTEQNSNLRNNYLALIEKILIVAEKCSNLLGIIIPNRM